MIPRRTHAAPSSAVLVALLALVLGACAAPATPTGTTSQRSEAVEVATDAHLDVPTTAPEPRLPVTVTGADGVDVTVTDVDRILAVDLYGTLAETVFALGLGDRVVGRDSSTGFEQAAGLPLVTVGGHSLSAEAILELDPTVVLTDTTIGPAKVQQQLRDAGIPVVFFEPTRSLDGVGGQIEAVAEALGVPEAGHELAERTEAEVAGLRTAADDDAPRVAFLYLRGSAVALLGGPGSGADSLITAVGGVDAGTAAGLERPFTQITSEALVTAAPDVLVLLEGGLTSVGGLDGLLRVPGVAQTPAGTARAVVTVTDTGFLSFGPRTPDVLRSLRAALDTAQGS